MLRDGSRVDLLKSLAKPMAVAFSTGSARAPRGMSGTVHRTIAQCNFHQTTEHGRSVDRMLFGLGPAGAAAPGRLAGHGGTCSQVVPPGSTCQGQACSI